MGIEVALGVGSLVLGAGSAYMQSRESSRARSAEKKRVAAAEEATNETRNRQAQIDADANRRAERERRVLIAQQLQSGENQGVAGSSGVQGGMSSTITQSGSILGQQLGQQASVGRESYWNSQAAMFGSQANSALGQANQWAQIGGFAGQLFNAAGGFGALFPKQEVQGPSANTSPGGSWWTQLAG